MTKKDLIIDVGHETGIGQTIVEKVITAMIRIIMQSIISGETIYIRGFGTLGPKLRKPKKAKLVKTGEVITIPFCVVPHFKPAKSFRESCKKD